MAPLVYCACLTGGFKLAGNRGRLEEDEFYLNWRWYPYEGDVNLKHKCVGGKNEWKCQNSDQNLHTHFNILSVHPSAC